MNKTLLSFAMAAVMSLAVVQPLAAGQKAVEVKPYSAADNGGYRISIPEDFMTENPTGDPYEYNKSFTMATTFVCYDVTKTGVIMGHRAEGHDNDNGSTIFVVNGGKLRQVGGAGNYNGDISDVVLENDVWYNLAASYNAENHMWKVYLDGKLVAENDNGQALKLFGDDPCILALGGRDFYGAFDDYLFYNHALTDTEINWALSFDPMWVQGLQLHYDFESVIEGTTSQFANIAQGEFAVSDVVATLKHWTRGTGWEPYVSVDAGDETTPTLVLGPRPAGALKLTLTVDGDGSGTVRYRKTNVDDSKLEILENATWVSKYFYYFKIEADADSEITNCSVYLPQDGGEQRDYSSSISEDGKTCICERVTINEGDSELFVTFSKTTSIDTVGAETEAEPEYFNLQGVRVSRDNIVPGVYVERRGTTTSKILVK